MKYAFDVEKSVEAAIQRADRRKNPAALVDIARVVLNILQMGCVPVTPDNDNEWWPWEKEGMTELDFYRRAYLRLSALLPELPTEEDSDADPQPVSVTCPRCGVTATAYPAHSPDCPLGQGDAREAKPCPKRAVGQWYEKNGFKYLLATVDVTDDAQVALIEMDRASRYHRPVAVKDVRDITDGEWAEITDGNEFTLIPDPLERSE